MSRSGVVVSSVLSHFLMSDPQIAPFVVPEYDAAMSIRDWHILFAKENVSSLTRLQAMTPGRIVLVTIDPSDRKLKVSFRTVTNAVAILPADEAEAVDPEKIIVMSYDQNGSAVVTRFRIGKGDPSDGEGSENSKN